jgi:hypothetical protein
LLVSLAISAVTFVVLEHPVRSWSFLRRRNVLSLALGFALTVLAVSLLHWTISRHAGPF